jgi:hypothetical protein
MIKGCFVGVASVLPIERSGHQGRARAIGLAPGHACSIVSALYQMNRWSGLGLGKSTILDRKPEVCGPLER